MSKAFQAFIGYDPRQPIAYAVVAHSLASRASRPLPITRLQLNQLPITRRGLTEFTYSRFLVPYLSDYDGYSLFLDADMIVLDDIWKILVGIDPMAAVSVVQHPERFEWPSLMLFNNKRCTNLSPAFVEDARNRLFDMAWASKIGALNRDWNHVVGYNQPNTLAKIVHYTKGVPCWPETDGTEWSAEWHAEVENLNSTVSFTELMGASVHVLKK